MIIEDQTRPDKIEKSDRCMMIMFVNSDFLTSSYLLIFRKISDILSQNVSDYVRYSLRDEGISFRYEDIIWFSLKVR